MKGIMVGKDFKTKSNFCFSHCNEQNVMTAYVCVSISSVDIKHPEV